MKIPLVRHCENHPQTLFASDESKIVPLNIVEISLARRYAKAENYGHVRSGAARPFPKVPWAGGGRVHTGDSVRNHRRLKFPICPGD